MRRIHSMNVNVIEMCTEFSDQQTVFSTNGIILQQYKQKCIHDK